MVLKKYCGRVCVTRIFKTGRTFGHGVRGVLCRLLAVIVLLAAVLQPASVARGADLLPTSATALPVASRDGVALGVNSDGSVGSMKVGSRILPRHTTRGGFSVRMAGGMPNLFHNPSFETDADANRVPDGWTFAGTTARPTWDASVYHTGKRSLKLFNATQATSGSFSVTVPVEGDANYFFSGWFKTQNVKPTAALGRESGQLDGSPVRVKVELLTKLSVVNTVYAYAYTDTANWHKAFIGFRAQKNLIAVRITTQIVAGSGTVWFDDFHVGRLLQKTEAAVGGTVRASTDGSGKLLHHADLTAQGLALDATYTPNANHIRVDGVVRSTVAADKPLQLTYTLPVNATGWRWADYARRAETIGAGLTNAHDTSKLNQNSRYPYRVVYDSKSALGMGIPLDQLRMFRIQYTPKGLAITFDLGLSRAATKMGPKASFSFVLYTSDPAWGFRAATLKNYQMFPSSFTRRISPEREGGWYLSPPYGSLDGKVTDYGLGLNLIALGTDGSQRYSAALLRILLWDNMYKIHATAYNHHGAYFQPMGSTTLPTYDQAVAKLQADANMTPTTPTQERIRDESLAALHSTERDYNGRLYYEQYYTKLAWYQAPLVLPNAPYDWARSVRKHQVDRALQMASDGGGALSGIHLDSVSGMRRWAGVEDFSRSHWAAAQIPLTFSYNSGLVTQNGVFSQFEDSRSLAAYLHSRSMLLTANFNANESNSGGYFLAANIDYFGIEQDLSSRNDTGPEVTTDSFAMLKRSIAGQRPVTTLDYRVGDGMALATLHREIQQNLFYGIYTGPHATDKTSWVTDPIQAVFATYSPIYRSLAAGGWAPVTNARSTNGNVWVERFGRAASNTLHLTLRNETASTQSYTLTVDLNRDGLTAVRSASALERVTGSSATVVLNSTKTQATIKGSIPATSSRVLMVAVTR